MEFLERAVDIFVPGIPMIVAIVVGIILLAVIHRILKQRLRTKSDRNMQRQLVMAILTFVLLVIIVIVSPITDNQKGQVLSLIGIILSAAIALSSTTLVGNAMAGLMLRSIKGFRAGDFVSVGDHFGRVSERGLFHVEVQTEFRDLVTLPNLYLVTNPVKVVRTSGTIVWAEVSLGYDISRSRIRDALYRAATESELKEPFVHVVSLGDFSVVYRVSGLLEDVKQLISARSRLRERMLDALHADGIEIVSPTFMSTRAYHPSDDFIPMATHPESGTSGGPSPEAMLFDKAEQAETIEELRERVIAVQVEINGIEKALKAADNESERSQLETRRHRWQQLLDRLHARIDSSADDQTS